MKKNIKTLSSFKLPINNEEFKRKQQKSLLELHRKSQHWKLPGQHGAASKKDKFQHPTDLTVTGNRRGNTEEETSQRGDMCSVTNRDHLTNAAFPGVGGRTGKCQQSSIFKR